MDNKTNNLSPTCVICQSDLRTTDDSTTLFTTECNHTFHTTCIQTWVKHQANKDEIGTCPLCRTQVSAMGGVLIPRFMCEWFNETPQDVFYLPFGCNGGSIGYE